MISLLERARARRRAATPGAGAMQPAPPGHDVVGSAGRILIRDALDRLGAATPACRAALGSARRERLVEAIALALGRHVVQAWDWALDAALPHVQAAPLPMPTDSETLLARLAARMDLRDVLALNPDQDAASLIAAMLSAKSAMLRETALDHADDRQRRTAAAHDGIAVLCRDWAGMRLLHMLDEQGHLTGGNRAALTEALLMSPVRNSGTSVAGEPALLAALLRGDRDAAAEILAAAAHLPRLAVDYAMAMKAPRALVSIAWRGGMSMSTAEAIQARLGGLPEAVRLRPSPAGDYPLSEREMAWQIGLLTGS